eukprot:ANDGO_03752.mRNA.1 hypothetical protein
MDVTHSIAYSHMLRRRAEAEVIRYNTISHSEPSSPSASVLSSSPSSPPLQSHTKIDATPFFVTVRPRASSRAQFHSNSTSSFATSPPPSSYSSFSSSSSSTTSAGLGAGSVNGSNHLHSNNPSSSSFSSPTTLSNSSSSSSLILSINTGGSTSCSNANANGNANGNGNGISQFNSTFSGSSVSPNANYQQSCSACHPGLERSGSQTAFQTHHGSANGFSNVSPSPSSTGPGQYSIPRISSMDGLYAGSLSFFVEKCLTLASVQLADEAAQSASKEMNVHLVTSAKDVKIAPKTRCVATKQESDVQYSSVSANCALPEGKWVYWECILLSKMDLRASLSMGLAVNNDEDALLAGPDAVGKQAHAFGIHSSGNMVQISGKWSRIPIPANIELVGNGPSKGIPDGTVFSFLAKRSVSSVKVFVFAAAKLLYSYDAQVPSDVVLVPAASLCREATVIQCNFASHQMQCATDDMTVFAAKNTLDTEDPGVYAVDGKPLDIDETPDDDDLDVMFV